MIDTWDYQWTFTCWSKDMISILPKYNQVYNLGFGQDATHTTDDAPEFVVDSVPQVLPSPLIHPATVKRSNDIDELINTIVFGISFSRFVKSKLREVSLIRYLSNMLRR